ncbi:MAG: diaminopimelate decarboxylase [Gaiellaceae bacterium]|nr:diaminopimelate decarboxylase [Gaiellaceae bacterium]
MAVNETVAAVPREADWPELMESRDGRLFLDGCDLEQVARTFGTPCWVASLRGIEHNYARFVAAWEARYPSIECHYSVKANNTLAIVRTLQEAGGRFDCTGEAEFEIVRMAGADTNRCIINGNGKSPAMLRLAAELGVRQINVDSIGEAQRLNDAAVAAGSVVDCVVRLQLGYEDLIEHDPSYESTLKIWEGKFGINVASGEADRVITYVRDAPGLRFAGLHHHLAFSGVAGDYTIAIETGHHRDVMTEICRYAKQISSELGVTVERIDCGGGFASGNGIFMVSPGNVGDGELHPLPAIDQYIDAVTEPIRAAFGDRLPTLQFETGRYQVAKDIVLVTAVTDVKDGHSTPPRRFITCDSSMQQFTAKGMQKVAHQVVHCTRADDPDNGMLADIVGQTCAYDSSAEDVKLPDVAVSDVLVHTGHGAYCDTSGSNFNAMVRPATVVVRDGRAALAKRHETIADIVERHAGPDLDWKG